VEDLGWAITVEPKFGIFQNSMSVEESMPYSVFERLTIIIESNSNTAHGQSSCPEPSTECALAHMQQR